MIDLTGEGSQQIWIDQHQTPPASTEFDQPLDANIRSGVFRAANQAASTASSAE
jgi:hypothetical protein